MRQIDPAEISHTEAHRYLLNGVAPRPIAFVGTVDAEGRPNLAPFSFFNAFGANPPVVAFSPAYRGTDGTPKHTFLNIRETGEFTVSVVTYSMVEQVSLASSDFPEGVDEYLKAGFTRLPSLKVKPFGVAESPMVMECRLLQHVDLGGKPASGNLMIGEVVMFHIKESAFEGPYPNYDRMDLVGRMGGPYYSRASGSAVFELAKPKGVGIGFDGLPESVRHSPVLTGSELAKLAGVEQIPSRDSIRTYWKERLADRPENPPDDFDLELRVGAYTAAAEILLERIRSNQEFNRREDFHKIAAACLAAGNVEEAWRCVMMGEESER